MLQFLFVWLLKRFPPSGVWGGGGQDGTTWLVLNQSRCWAASCFRGASVPRGQSALIRVSASCRSLGPPLLAAEGGISRTPGRSLPVYCSRGGLLLLPRSSHGATFFAIQEFFGCDNRPWEMRERNEKWPPIVRLFFLTGVIYSGQGSLGTIWPTVKWGE